MLGEGFQIFISPNPWKWCMPLVQEGSRIRMDRMVQWDSQEHRLSEARVLTVSSLWNFQSSWCLLFWWWLLNLSSDQLPVTLYTKHVFIYRLIVGVFSFLKRNILYEYKRWVIYIVLHSQAKMWELVSEDFSDTLCVLLMVCCVGTCTAQLLKKVSPSMPGTNSEQRQEVHRHIHVLLQVIHKFKIKFFSANITPMPFV